MELREPQNPLRTLLRSVCCHTTPWAKQKAQSMETTQNYETGGILFREYCFGRENSLSSTANSVSSARNSVSSRSHTDNRLRGAHSVRSPELSEPKKITEFSVRNRTLRNRIRPISEYLFDFAIVRICARLLALARVCSRWRAFTCVFGPFCQKFRKGVGGHRGLARRNSSYSMP